MGLHILDFILVDSFIVEGSPLGQSLIDTIQYINLNPFPAFTLNPFKIKKRTLQTVEISLHSGHYQVQEGAKITVPNAS